MKDIYEYSFLDDEINISVPSILNAMGYKKATAPQPVLYLLDEIIPQITKLINVNAGFRILNSFRLNEQKDSIFVDDVQFNTGTIIAKPLRNASAAAVFVATAGPQIEKMSKDYLLGEDPLKGYLLDAIGSEIVECAADLLEVKLQEIISGKNLKTTNRYSPGYCGWIVKEQHKLFSLLPKNFCGITLTDSALMVPIKSVSGIIGLGSNVKKHDYQCSICELESCFRRRTK